MKFVWFDSKIYDSIDSKVKNNSKNSIKINSKFVDSIRLHLYNDLPQALKYIKIASKLTSIVTILVSIALAGDHIFQVLAQYSWVLP